MSLNSLIGQDGGGIFIDRAEVVGNAEKYLALLRVRATTNPQLESTLRHYDEAYSAYKNKSQVDWLVWSKESYLAENKSNQKSYGLN